MKLRIAYIDENGNEVTDPEVIRRWEQAQLENCGNGPETITLTMDMLLKQESRYIPGCGWL